MNLALQIEFLLIAIFIRILIQLELATGTFTGHIACLAKDGPLLPGTIEATKNPEDSRITIWVAPVYGIFVVQLNKICQGNFGRRGPLQHLLPPKHTQVVVHDPLLAKLCLGSIPELIMRL